MNPRVRRLQADLDQMSQTFADHPYIQIVETRGTPPESYVIEFQIRGLVPNQDD